MKKASLFLILIVLIVLAVAAFNLANHIGGSQVGASGQPARLSIPHLHIDAPVMSVGQTASGVMDAPTSNAYNSPYWTSVFWYSPGAEPGQVGNVVIAGHIDRVGGDPAVFWGLGSLQPGDSITLTTNDGTQYHYTVNRVVTYPANYSSQDAFNAVFGPTSARHLNLITCSGLWTGNGYDKRLVVMATQVG